jgi:hypothetical protein
VLLVAALLYLVGHWRLGPRVVGVLAGLPVQTIVEAHSGAMALTTYGSLWKLGTKTPQVALPEHFDMPLLDDPARRGPLVVAGSNAGGLMAWDLSAAGGRAWDRPFDTTMTAPPAVYGDVALVALWPASLAAMDLRTGAAKWTLPLGSAVRMRPLHWRDTWVVIDREDRLWFISDAGKALSYLNLEPHIVAADCEPSWMWAAWSDGRVAVWSAPERGRKCSTEPGVCRLKAGDGLAVVGTGEGAVLGLTAGGGEPKVLWRRGVRGPVTAVAGPIRTDGNDLWAIGTAAGMVYLLDARTGRRVQRVRVCDSPVTTVEAIGGNVVAGGSEGAWQWPLPR